MFLGRISLKKTVIFPGTPFESRKVRFKIENPSAPALFDTREKKREDGF
jgi:hypothetical protein